MSFSWRYVPPVDADVIPGAPSSFANQSDAESWLGEVWRELAANGVETVSLYEDATFVYEMSLAP